MPDLTDPTRPSRVEISRKGFVALSAGAAVAAGPAGLALADDVKLGGFHTPLVPENDPDIAVERPTLARPGGAIDAYAASPKGATVVTPGIVVVQHIWGVDAQIRDVVRRFAKAGYVTIAPALYSRLNAPNGDAMIDYAQFSPYAQKLVDDQVDGDLVAGATWIRARVKKGADSRPPRVGIAGFCMGGSITIRASVDCPQFDAAAVWYGKIRQATITAGGATEISLAYIDEVRMPVVGSYGGRDTGIPPDDVRALRSRLKVPNDIKIYDEAGHAFFDDQRASYVASAAAESWTRVLAWFSKYLSATGPAISTPSP